MQMTMRYAHLAPNNLREAVELMGLEKPAAEKRTRSVATVHNGDGRDVMTRPLGPK
jgi:hypothetical protein